MTEVARFQTPNRMYSHNVRITVDENPLNAILDYVFDKNGILPVAVWIKTKKSESTLDRELRSSSKAVSLLLQYGCPLKDISDTFTRDSIIGSVIWYINKNIEDILSGNQPDKTPNLSTQPTGYTIK
tara:strand:- start:2519 stop:2899 length:381 start_codon:yes stop_codon:yes gene_type:complete